MTDRPSVGSSVSFYELNPSGEGQCIFLTIRDERCRWTCDESDRTRAIELYEIITALPIETVSLKLLQEYIWCSCCGDEGTHHQHSIVKAGLLKPLAEQWQDEIRRSAHDKLIPGSSPEQSTRYNFRDRKAHFSTYSPSLQFKLSLQPTLTGFHPHFKSPSSRHSAYQKLLDPLGGRDSRPGSLYIFDRASSPGYVKIGWTGTSVQNRLKSWSKCGYNPNLLFSVDKIPHAQRVETLAHYELIKEWRREWSCKGCGTSHKEWFETSKERARQVIEDWADFMKTAQPYDSNGELEDRWRKVVEIVNGKGEAITAKKLLEQYEACLVKETAIVKGPGDQGHTRKIIEGMDVRCGSMADCPEAPENSGFKRAPLSPSRVQRKSLPKTEPVRGAVLETERTEVKQEPSDGQSPSSPLLPPQSTPLLQDRLPSQDTKPCLSPGTEEISPSCKITNTGTTQLTAVDTSSSNKTNSLSSFFNTISHSVVPINTTTASSPPRSSNPSSEPRPLQLTISTSRTSEVDRVYDPPAPIMSETSEALLSLSINEKKEIVETVKPVRQRQQDMTGDRETSSEGGGSPRRDGPIRESVAKRAQRPRASNWSDSEETFVEDQITRSLEKTELGIVGGRDDEISSTKANGLVKGFDGLKLIRVKAKRHRLLRFLRRHM